MPNPHPQARLPDTRLTIFAPTLILLAGFALRVFRLGDANLWWDEAFSAYVARKPLPDLLQTTAFDTHPPLYYLQLKGWMALAGPSEFALRTLSVIAGVLLVALTYRMAARLIGRRWGTLAAGLLAVSRFHIWWSQEIRMYAWAALWIGLALAMLGELAALPPQRRTLTRWALFGLGLAGAMFSLYLAGLVVIVAGLGVLGLWAAKRFTVKDVAAYVLANAATGAALLPWVLYAIPRIRPDAPADSSFTLAQVTGLYTTLLATGISIDYGSLWPLLVLYGLVLAGSAAWLVARGRWIAAVLIPALVVPPLFIYTFVQLDWRYYSPILEARYFLLFLGACLIIPAAGAMALDRWRRGSGVALALGLVALSAWALPGYYGPRTLRDQWKSAVQIIETQAEPGDVVVLVSGSRYPTFLYEYEQLEGEKPRFAIVPDGAPLLTAENAGAQMARAVGGARRVWLVESEVHLQDPERRAREWLEGYGTAVMESRFAHNGLALYDPAGAAPTVMAGAARPLKVFSPVHEFRPGDAIHAGVIAEGQHTLALVDGRGVTWAEAALSSNRPAWADVTFEVTRAHPRGGYELRLDGETAERVRITHSDRFWNPRDVPEPVGVTLGGRVELVGYGLTPRRFAPGDTLQLDLYWRAPARIGESYTVFTHILGPTHPEAAISVWGQHDSPPVMGALPTDRWPAGVTIRDTHPIEFDPAAPAGTYRLVVGLYEPATGERLDVPGAAERAIVLAEFTVGEGQPGP